MVLLSREKLLASPNGYAVHIQENHFDAPKVALSSNQGADESYVSTDVDETGAEHERPFIELSPGWVSARVRGRSPSAPATPPKMTQALDELKRR